MNRKLLIREMHEGNLYKGEDYLFHPIKRGMKMRKGKDLFRVVGTMIENNLRRIWVLKLGNYNLIHTK